ncbi:MAG: phage tail tape measure protein [Clostridia bacterium]|nr:phage tail tape measure protein [Clostridia bacterium]
MSVTRKIETKLTLDGEAQFKSEMQSVSTSMKSLKSEMALVTSEFAGNANSVGALTAKHEILQKQVDQQKQKVSTLNRALGEASNAYGENSDEAEKYRTKLNYAKADLNKMNTALVQNDKYLDEAKKSTDGCATSIDKYGKEVKTAGSNSEEFGKKSTSAVDSLSEALAAAGITAILSKIGKAFLSCVEAAASFADEIGTTSLQTGIATDKLQAYEYAAELVDVSVDTLTSSMARNIRSMGDARDGTTETVEAYEKLGVSVTDANGELRDGETVYWEIIDALGNMTNETDRDEVAMTLLGRSAQDLNPLIIAGADAMSELADEAQAAGYILSDETLVALQELDDQLQRLDDSSEAFENTLGAALAPMLEGLAASGTDILQTATDFVAKNPDTVKAFTAIAASAGGAAAALSAYKVASKALSTLGISLASLGSVAGFAAIFGASVYAIAGTIDYLNNLVEETDDLTYAQQQLDDATKNLTEVQEMYGDAVWEAGTVAGNAYDYARVAVAEAQKQVDELTATQAEAGDSTDDLADRQEALATAMDTYSTKVASLMTAYQEAYNAAYESISGQMGLFDTITVTVGTDVDQMITSLQSQEAYMSTYAENIKAAAEMGLSDGLIKELSDGSVESAAYLQAIVDAGAEKIPELNDAFSKVEEGKDTFASAVADMQTSFSDTLDEITQDAADAIGDLDLYDDAYTSATNTMDGYLAGLDNQSGALYSRMSSIAASALSSFNATLGISSPSREFAKSGGHSIEGYMNEVERRSSGLNDLMGNVAGSALAAFSSAQVKTGTAALFSASARPAASSGGVTQNVLNSISGAINGMAATQNGQAASGDLTIIVKMNDGTEIVRALLPEFRKVSAASPELGGS